ncbi:hypothetical protein [Synechococcus sp. MIT S9509]|uniref:hypothetical protein n=1 Tax=unclassified Synechococcus TaxID=2626047 RepID=UPI0039B12340
MVSREEAGPIVTPDGRTLWAGDPGFLEAMGELYGFPVESEPSGTDNATDGLGETAEG